MGPNQECTEKSCWDQDVTDGGWSPHQMWRAAWGKGEPDWDAGWAFPQMYNHEWGKDWRKTVNRVAKKNDRSEIVFSGPLAGCGHGGQIESTDVAYRAFAREVRQTRKYLTFFHALDRSC